MARSKFVTITYGENIQPFQTITLSLSQKAFQRNVRTPWLVYIHGGAWRDPNMTKAMGNKILNDLPDNWAGASIDYRLSPEVKHPVHLADVIVALDTLKQQYGLGTDEVVIAGHSAGATLAFQAFSTLVAQRVAYGTVTGGNTQTAVHLSDSVKYIIGVAGIYNFTALGQEYPSYKGFLSEAFGEKNLWDDASPNSFQWSKIANTSNAKIVLVQSSEDELLSVNQIVEFAKLLGTSGYTPHTRIINGGSHNETVESEELLDMLREIYLDIDQNH
ncbi:Alpha/Beta hydrolase protein [Lipomyces japonicus]|uniref:Alpha/Beta hydrolase protein n=1 Tax=Lipomyces japonicus TaxID=56871 RepID=UPI0034CD65AF